MTAVKPLIYHTLEGIEVPYGPVSSKLIGIVSAKYPTDIDPPTYKFEDVTGEIQELPHDETSIESESTPDEEKKAWAEYLEKKIELLRKHNDEIVRACFLQGIKLSPPDDDAWLAPYRYLGVDIPEDPNDLKLFWLFMEVVRTPEDIRELAQAIMHGGGTLKEMRAVAASTFRDSLGNGSRANAGAASSEDSNDKQRMVA